MNKVRRKKYKRGIIKRLAQESFVLSFTRYLSSRFVRFFESGLASPLITSAKSTDNFAREKITGPIYKRIGIRKNFFMPMRNAASSLISRNPVMKMFEAFRTAFLSASMRSVGVFLITFGIYATAILLLKSYVSLSLGAEASINDFSVAAVTALVGIILVAFGDRSILSAVGTGRIVGSLLVNCLGVNDSSIDRHISASSVTSVGISFLLGSLFGISTLFFAPATVLFFALALIVCIAVLHIPEFGLLLVATVFSFVNVKITAVVIAVTVASFLIKCLRLKRNFRFGTADAVVLLLYVVIFVSCVTSEGSLSHSELYVLCFTSVYFLAKNLLCSEKLVVQTLNALCLGVSLGMALYILGDFATLIPHDDLRMGAVWLTRHTLDAEMLAMTVSCILPFALMSFSSSDERKPKWMFAVLSVVCAIIVDSTLFYVLLIMSVLVYVATAYKAPVGALLSAVIVIPPVAALAADYTAASAVALRGKTVYDAELLSPVQESFTNFWSGMYRFGGLIAVILFVVAVLLILQRIFGTTAGNHGNKTALLGGTAAASVIMAIICSFIFDPFCDFRVLAEMLFLFGFSKAVSKTYSMPQYTN